MQKKVVKKPTKKKNIKPTTVNPHLSKLLSLRDMHSYYSNRMTSNLIDQIISELLKWIEEDPKAITLDRFLYAKKISWQNWSNWMEKFPQLKIANEHVKLFFAYKREEGALYGDINPNVAMFMLPRYSKHWKEANEWRAKLRDGEKTGSGNVTVIVDGVPSSDLVPSKPVKNDE